MGFLVRFLVIYAVCLATLYGVGTRAFGQASVFVLLVLAGTALPFCLAAAWVVNRAAARLSRLLANLTIRRKRSGSGGASVDLTRAERAFREGRYGEALSLVASLLASEPDHAEALYLKALILWKGFAMRSAASACLNRVMDLSDPSSEVYLRASADLCELAGPDLKSP